MMSPHRIVLLLPLLLLSPPGTLLAAGDGYYPPSKPIVTPVTKDSTGLYTIPVKNGAPLVLDLSGPLVWSTCPASQPAMPCELNPCQVARHSHPAGCAGADGGQQQPSSSSPDSWHCTCTAYPYNPATRQCAAGTVTTTPLSANATDGNNPLYPVSFSTYEACAPDGLLASLPSGAAGVAGLSRQTLSLPSQVASRFKVARQFAICFPGGGQTGAAIFGGGPFHLQASRGPLDIAEDLRRNPLPLVRNPKNDGAYYFRVHGFSVNQKQVPIPPGAFDLDPSSGTGGVVFSTVTAYTTLRSDIYRPLLEAFDAVTTGIPRAAAPAQAPRFERCYQSSAFYSTLLGPGVASIDLALDGGRTWMLFGASSLVGVDDHTLCFAFLEMGPEEAAARGSPAVIVGTYQLENNMLLFDLEKETFGLSGLLYGLRTTCGNFNFATGSS